MNALSQEFDKDVNLGLPSSKKFLSVRYGWFNATIFNIIRDGLVWTTGLKSYKTHLAQWFSHCGERKTLDSQDYMQV